MVEQAVMSAIRHCVIPLFTASFFLLSQDVIISLK